MIHIIIGAAVTAGLLLFIHTCRRNNLSVKWWQWFLTVLGFVYLTFFLELIAGFLEEGMPKGALVMGTIFGFIAVVWAFFLKRSIFSSKKTRSSRHV